MDWLLKQYGLLIPWKELIKMLQLGLWVDQYGLLSLTPTIQEESSNSARKFSQA